TRRRGNRSSEGGRGAMFPDDSNAGNPPCAAARPEWSETESLAARYPGPVPVLRRGRREERAEALGEHGGGRVPVRGFEGRERGPKIPAEIERERLFVAPRRIDPGPGGIRGAQQLVDTHGLSLARHGDDVEESEREPRPRGLPDGVAHEHGGA